MEIARSDAGKVEGVDGGEEEERGEDEGDGGACHHLLLHCYRCLFRCGRRKEERKIQRKIDTQIYAKEKIKTNEVPLFLFLVTLLLSLVTQDCKKLLINN